MNNCILVSYFTLNTPYRDYAHDYLLASIGKINTKEQKIKCDIRGIESLGSWEKNCSYKPTFLLHLLDKYKENLLWADCDAEICEYPSIFDNIPENIDIAVHYLDWMLHYGWKGRQLASGTIFLRNNDKVRQLLKLWASLTDKYRLDQESLDEAIKQSKDIKVLNLDREYCYITSTPKGLPPKVPLDNPIIKHSQASRSLKRSIR
jgi:hypothetical protein